MLGKKMENQKLCKVCCIWKAFEMLSPKQGKCKECRNNKAEEEYAQKPKKIRLSQQLNLFVNVVARILNVTKHFI